MIKHFFIYFIISINLVINSNITYSNEPSHPYAQITISQTNEATLKSNSTLTKITVEKKQVEHLDSGKILNDQIGISVDETCDIKILDKYPKGLNFIKNYRKNFSIINDSFAILQTDNKSMEKYFNSIGEYNISDTLNYFAYSNGKYYTKQHIDPDQKDTGSELIFLNNKIYHFGLEIDSSKASFNQTNQLFNIIPFTGIPCLTYLYEDSTNSLNTNDNSVNSELILINDIKVCRVTYTTYNDDVICKYMYFFNLDGALIKYAYEIMHPSSNDRKKEYQIGIYDILKFSNKIPDKSIYSITNNYKLSDDNTFWSLNFI